MNYVSNSGRNNILTRPGSSSFLSSSTSNFQNKEYNNNSKEYRLKERSNNRKEFKKTSYEINPWMDYKKNYNKKIN